MTRNAAKYYIGVILVGLVLVGCNAEDRATPVPSGSSFPPPSALNAPIYPGATHIISDTTSTVNVKVYEFQTYDKPEKVLKY